MDSLKQIAKVIGKLVIIVAAVPVTVVSRFGQLFRTLGDAVMNELQRAVKALDRW